MAEKKSSEKKRDLLQILQKQNLTPYTGNDLYKFLKVKKIPSGVFIFDYLTEGGIPEGRFTMFHGAKSSGKTTMALKVAHQFLELNPDKLCVFFDLEHSFDPDFNNVLVKHLDRFVYIDPDYGEQAIEAIRESIKTPEVGFIIIDSVAMLIPTAEAEADATDDFTALQPRLLNKMFRKIIPLMADRRKTNPVTVLLINQVRARIGAQRYGAQTQTPGGYLQAHIVSLDVRFYNKAYIKRNQIPVAATFQFTVAKSKVSPPNVSGEYTLAIKPHDDYDIGDPIEVKQVVAYARKHRLIEKDGKYYCLADRQWTSVAQLVIDLENDSDLFNQVKQEILSKPIDISKGDNEDVEAVSDM